jgi:uncharacterized protein YjbI with pentapeptide repeats
MVRLLVPNNLSCAWIPCALPGVGLQMIVVCKATMDLNTGLAVAEAVPVMGDVEDPEPAYPSDFAPFKPRADVIVRATAHVPDARPTPYLQVGIKIGSLEKRLLVVGDRQWQRGLLGWNAGDPQRFDSMPLRWSRALGGPGDPMNPLGCGRDGKRMPNVELPDRLVQSPRESVAPAGFGPTAAAWQPRCSMVGTYGSDYVKKYWPWFPPDFDFGYFNAAPADQQVAGYLRGDEELRFENLHRAHRTLTTRLPGLRSRLFVTMADGEFREVPQRLDTLFCDLEQDRLTLVWRGHSPIANPAMLGLEHVLATLEPMSAPKEAAHYRAMRDDSLRKKTAKAAVAEQEAKTPAEHARAAAAAAVAKEMAAAEAHAEAAWQAQQQVLAEKGAFAVAAAGADLKALVARMQQSAAALGAGAGANPGLPKIDVEELTAMAAVPSAPKQAPAWTRETVLEAHARGVGFAGQKLAGLDLSACDLRGIDLAGADLTGCKLDGADLTKAVLTAAILPGAKCNGTKLDAALLDRADLTGVLATGASWRGASLERTLLTALVGAQGDFSGSRGVATQFAGADLTKCTFAGASLGKADFTGCKLQGADFTQAQLAEVRLHAADASAAVFHRAEARGLRADDGAVFAGADFRHADVDGCVLELADLRSCDFRYARLGRALLNGANLTEADLSRADLSAASLSDAVLVKARLLQCNLKKASLDRCDCALADLRWANLYGAGLWETKLERADLRGANVASTLLAVR